MSSRALPIKSKLAAGVLTSLLLGLSTSAVAGPVKSHGVDFGVVNQDRMISMLKKTGVIAKDANETESVKALYQYLSAIHVQKPEEGELASYEEKRNKRLLGLMGSESSSSAVPASIARVQEENAWTGPVTQDKVLAILIEFPDYPANMVTPGETSNYYEDYTPTHYQNMLFGRDGYVGSNGNNLISMVQFYEQQSGGSYTQIGGVAGWYKAKHPAAFYGAQQGTTRDVNARDLVREALVAAAADPNVNLGDYDLEDRYDLDGDGNLREPDGLVDHIMIFHSGVGQEAGGGNLGSDAIWSHRWNLGKVFAIEGTTSPLPNWGGSMAAYDYTIQPIDAAAGVAAHEYGHDLGLPDEYDTIYGEDEWGSTPGEPVSYWSIMSSGSWAGLIPGTEPTGFSPWARQFLQNSLGGNWLHGKTVEFDQLNTSPQSVVLDQASSKGSNHDYLRINLPPKVVKLMDVVGTQSFYSQRGDNLNTNSQFDVAIPAATSAALTFKVNYDIEDEYDFGRVLVNGTPIAGDITTTYDPHEIGYGIGFTGVSDGWVDANFDLTAYAGQTVTITFNYLTDGGYVKNGYWFDEVKVTADAQQVAHYNAESAHPELTFDGMILNDGRFEHEHYYLAEWRQHEGVDKGLAHINRNNHIMTFDPGLVLWYVDTSHTDNGVSSHPGEGWLGVVDADRNPQFWSDGTPATSRYQVRDAAFNTKTGNQIHLVDRNGLTLDDPYVVANPMFADWEDYSNPIRPATGRLTPHYGIVLQVVDQAADGSSATINMMKLW
ncbi:immune inhibitor A [Vibrio nigripulchritudo]|uniref:immune inhibitor A domain-containing protein n=1 Tax=Vibrio nigripulchritudo TaxID=28173 RepID=UPI00190E3826|nr:immune inhibitor A domain-containing protein [Vibrio nigripulchritudo]BCL70141.1 immune inhibitor A [Vibrio nigripulchritudo]BDU31491.1 immune inhibitor A [Vibrio nigripulchritudo]